MSPDASERALTLLAAAGQHATPARLAVLETLLDADRTLSHHEVDEALRKRSRYCDRVTLYRVLEWLVRRGLAHKIAGVDRVWRFNAADHELHPHAHFQCTRCKRVYCLEELEPDLAFKLPPGFRYEHADLKLQGACADCRA